MDTQVTSAFDMLQAKLDERYHEASKQIAGARALFTALGSPDGAVAPDATTAKSSPPAVATAAVVKKAPAKKPAAAPKKKANANKPSANKPSGVRQAVLGVITKDWATADKIRTDTGLTDPQIRAILNAVDLKSKIEKRESDAGVMYKLKA